MSDILSQDEVDALLKAVGEGALPTDAPSPDEPVAGTVRTIDLTNQERSLRGRMPGLDVVLGRLARDLRGSLATFFGSVPNVTVGGVELVKFGSFMTQLRQPIGLLFYKLAPLRGQGMLILRPPLVAAVLQVLFGGTPGRPTPPATREFSAIEQRVLERLATRILGDLREAWRPVAAMDCSLLRIETNPLFATIATAHELVLLTEIQVAAEGFGDLAFSIAIPNGALEPVRPALARIQEAEGADAVPEAGWHERLQLGLAEAPVEMRVELGRRQLPMSKVLALKVGDVVALGTGREGPVVVRVGGRPHFLGTPGVAGSSNAVSITARM